MQTPCPALLFHLSCHWVSQTQCHVLYLPSNLVFQYNTAADEQPAIQYFDLS
jgi:hypothetical protein